MLEVPFVKNIIEGIDDQTKSFATLSKGNFVLAPYSVTSF